MSTSASSAPQRRLACQGVGQLPERARRIAPDSRSGPLAALLSKLADRELEFALEFALLVAIDRECAGGAQGPIFLRDDVQRADLPGLVAAPEVAASERLLELADAIHGRDLLSVQECHPLSVHARGKAEGFVGHGRRLRLDARRAKD